MGQPPRKTGYQLWQDTVNRGPGDAAWSSYDADLQVMATEINTHLANTPGYRSLDWQLVKAMIWTESGAAHPQWQIKPMQIGVKGDPGLAALLGGREGGDLILPPAWAQTLTAANAATTPTQNLHAGIGYLMMRAANFDWQTVVAADAPVLEVAVKAGDSFARIASANGSTPDHVAALNPGVSPNALRPGQKLKVQRASLRRVITGWRVIDSAMVAARYNGGGDPNYARKIDYCLSLIRGG